MTFLYLFLEFFKTGLFAIGGGMATIPFLYEIATNYDWYTTADLVDMIAVSEATPGPVGVNMATFAGYMAGKIPGSFVATLSLVLPAYCIILCIAGMLDKFQNSSIVQRAFWGLRPAVVGLLTVASLAIFKVTFFTEELTDVTQMFALIDLRAVVIFIVLLVGIMKLKKHPLLYILAGAAAGIIMNL